MDEVYGAIETANGELGFYLVADGSGRPWRARTRPPSFIHFAVFPHMIEGHLISDVRGGAGEPEHHRGGVGPVSVSRSEPYDACGSDGRRCDVLSDDDPKDKIRAYIPRYPSKQAVTLPALHIVHDELRCVPYEAIARDRRDAGAHPAEVHDTMSFYGFFRARTTSSARRGSGSAASLACMLRGGEELLEHCCEQARRPAAARRRPTARSRSSSPSASASATAPRRAW